MYKLKIAFSSFFAAFGILTFLRIVGQELQLQRRELEIEKMRDVERKRKEAMMLPVASVASDVNPAVSGDI